MNSEDYQHFVCIVAGDNPEELMEQYDSNKKVEPYLVYKYCDAEKLKALHMKMYEAALKNENLSESEREELLSDYSWIATATPDEFYDDLTDGLTLKKTTRDAYSDKNKNGKWRHHQLGKNFSIPFLTLKGEEKYQAHKSEVDWSSMHLSGQDVYRRAWEIVIDGEEPQNETEKLIYDNMKERKVYFMKFGTKENYVMSSTAFWGYAFLSKETGWIELGDTQNQFEWVSNFYDRFIAPLPENTLLSVYECIK